MISFRLQEYAEVSSTNDVVKRAIEAGESEGFAVRAEVQTAGYGRQGRTWTSPAGGLYLSLLLRPHVEQSVLPTLSLATAIAVRRALAGLVARHDADAIWLKWPNDLVVAQGPPSPGDAVSDACAVSSRYRKIAGFSHELHAGAMCAGIGVNVEPPHGRRIEIGGKNVPIYLRELSGAEDVALTDVAQAVLREFSAVYDTWLDFGIEALLDDYQRHSYLTGRAVRIEAHDGAVLCAGVARGVDGQGRLVVEDETKVLHKVASGEAHLA